MILDIKQIKNIILNNPNKALIDLAKANNKKLRMHLYGEGLKDVITAIAGHEKDDLRLLRQKYAKSNKDLFTRLARPIDKVFTAKGGSTYYNMSDVLNSKAILLSMNIKDGLSVRKWIEYKWKPHALDDPNGLLFMEIGAPIDGVVVPYATYKSITTIFDYQSTGIKLDYIVFNVTLADKLVAGYNKEDIIYRVVDDVADYWVERDGEEVTIMKGDSFVNQFNEVPALLNSDILSPEVDGLMCSLFSDVIELADDFIQTGSIRNLAKIRMAYPKYWEYADDCPTCHGTQYDAGEKCSTCKGSGKRLMLNPGDAKLLNYPENKDAPIITPNVAGFVEFPKNYFDHSTAELLDIENMMTLTVWGTETKTRTKGLQTSGGTTNKLKTATEVVDDMQPKADRLQIISEMAERRHKFIMDCMIKIALKADYTGASINYGRRYMIESADSIWDRYSQARQDGGSVSILDKLLAEFIEVEYSSDPVGLSIQQKLLTVEPFVHLTIQALQLLNPAFIDYNLKLYFSEWLATLHDSVLIVTEAEQLRALLLAYVTAKNLVEPQVVAVLPLNPPLKPSN